VPFIDKNNTDVLTPEGGINWFYFILGVIDGVLTFAAGVLLITAFKYALYGKLNQGVVSSLFSLTSIYLAI